MTSFPDQGKVFTAIEAPDLLYLLMLYLALALMGQEVDGFIVVNLIPLKAVISTSTPARLRNVVKRTSS